MVTGLINDLFRNMRLSWFGQIFTLVHYLQQWLNRPDFILLWKGFHWAISVQWSRRLSLNLFIFIFLKLKEVCNNVFSILALFSKLHVILDEVVPQYNVKGPSDLDEISRHLTHSKFRRLICTSAVGVACMDKPLKRLCTNNFITFP